MVLDLCRARTGALRLRPCQGVRLKSCLDALKSGSTKIGVSLPTAAGETAVFVSLLEWLSVLSGNPKVTRSLVILPRRWIRHGNSSPNGSQGRARNAVHRVWTDVCLAPEFVQPSALTGCISAAPCTPLIADHLGSGLVCVVWSPRIEPPDGSLGGCRSFRVRRRTNATLQIDVERGERFGSRQVYSGDDNSDDYLFEEGPRPASPPHECGRCRWVTDEFTGWPPPTPARWTISNLLYSRVNGFNK